MERARKIKLIAFDVDGILTPGTLLFGPEGEAYKAFNVRDGMGMALAHGMGFKIGFITGRTSPTVEARGHELKTDFMEMGVMDKVTALENVMKRWNLTWEETAFMGDDLNDLPVFQRCGLSACPSDACIENKNSADFVSALPGGQGAARELIEMVLRSQGRWKEVVDYFLGLSEK